MPASVLKKRWTVRDPGSPEPFEMSRLVMRLLKLRGVTSRPEARAYLKPDLPDVVHLPNMDVAVERLARAIRAGERVAVYGDYDADGMTATAILVEGILALGGDAIPYIPERRSEGYGLNRAALSVLKREGATVIVTVDTGTSAVDEIDYANEHNLDVIVADHHTLPPRLPDAVAVVNPHLEGTPDSHTGLAGCGVAYTLLIGLADRMSVTLDREQFLDLVAIGTVCDVAPLNGANRALVSEGLRRIARRERPGLAALMDTARLTPGRLGAHAIGFTIGPRLNAAGRLDHAIKAYELLTTRDERRAYELARELEGLNRRRQDLTETALTIGRSLAREHRGHGLMMVGHPDIDQGIIGLVAGKLAMEFYRPAVVYEQGAEFSVGSARSIPEFNIVNALRQAAHVVERYGGHSQAGGFQVRTERLEELRAVLTDWAAEQLDWSSLTPELSLDLELDLDDLPSLLLDEIERMEPFGQDNAVPRFVARRMRVTGAWVVGKEGRHLRLRLAGPGGAREWEAVGFWLGKHLPRPGTVLDIAFSLHRDRRDGAELWIEDFEILSSSP